MFKVIYIPPIFSFLKHPFVSWFSLVLSSPKPHSTISNYTSGRESDRINISSHRNIIEIPFPNVPSPVVRVSTHREGNQITLAYRLLGRDGKALFLLLLVVPYSQGLLETWFLPPRDTWMDPLRKYYCSDHRNWWMPNVLFSRCSSEFSVSLVWLLLNR